MPEARIEEADARLAYLRRPETDMEVCSTIQSVTDFARGHSQWSDFPQPERRRALGVIEEHHGVASGGALHHHVALDAGGDGLLSLVLGGHHGGRLAAQHQQGGQRQARESAKAVHGVTVRVA